MLVQLPPLSVIAQYHPQWALAAAEGVAVRPSVRPLSVQFSSTANVGTQEEASYDTPITLQALFTGAELTVDPTTAFAQNILKGLNDATLEKVSGVTVTILSTDATGNFTPVFDETPLQSVPRLLQPFCGIWKVAGPAANLKATFTLNSIPNGGVPFTAWLNMSFAELEGPCAEYFGCSRAVARKRLREDHGICCASA